jgi:pimeloyl-ACP methyl ester carboxylesterase
VISRLQRSTLIATVVVALLSGCGAGSQGEPGDPGDSDPSPTAAAPRCMPDGDADEIFFEGTDGTMLAAVEAGEGPLGVVLVHGSGNAGRCVWTNETPSLTEAGFHILAIDHACVGVSDCPDEKDKVADIEAAAAELRRRGAEVVAVIGASAGTSETIVAGAHAELDAVIALSPMGLDVAVTLTPPETVSAAASAIAVPTLLVVGTDDRNASVDAVTALSTQLPAGVATLLVVEGGGHAQELLYPEGADADSAPGGPTYDAVIAFLTEHLG